MWKCTNCGTSNETEFCCGCGGRKTFQQQNNQQYNQQNFQQNVQQNYQQGNQQYNRQNSQGAEREPEVVYNDVVDSTPAWVPLPEKKKKKTVIVIICAVIAVLAIIVGAVVAVNVIVKKDDIGDKIEERKSDSETESDPDPEPEVVAESELAEYFIKHKEEIEELEKESSVNDLKIEIFAEGNSVVYKCTITNVSVKDITDDDINAMKGNVKAMEQSLLKELDKIRKEVPSVESFIYRYYDKDGKFIYKIEIGGDEEPEPESEPESESESELEKYVRENKDTFESQEKAQSNSNMTMKITAEGNSLVYEFTVKNLLKKDVTDDMIAAMESELEKQKSTVKTAMKLIRTGVPSLESIIYRYCDKNGNLIYEIELDDKALEEEAKKGSKERNSERNSENFNRD